MIFLIVRNHKNIKYPLTLWLNGWIVGFLQKPEFVLLLCFITLSWVSPVRHCSEVTPETTGASVWLHTFLLRISSPRPTILIPHAFLFVLWLAATSVPRSLWTHYMRNRSLTVKTRSKSTWLTRASPLKSQVGSRLSISSPFPQSVNRPSNQQFKHPNVLYFEGLLLATTRTVNHIN